MSNARPNWAGSCQSWPNPAELGTKTANCSKHRPSLVRARKLVLRASRCLPTSSQTWSTSANFGRNLAEFGRSRANFVQSWGRFCRTRPKLVRKRPHGPAPTDFAPNSTNSGQRWPGIGHTFSTKFGRLGRFGNELVQIWPCCRLEFAEHHIWGKCGVVSTLGRTSTSDQRRLNLYRIPLHLGHLQRRNEDLGRVLAQRSAAFRQLSDLP